MNKRGFVIFYSLMIGVVLFVLGLAFAPALTDTMASIMNGSEIHCATPSSNQDRAICTQLDMFSPLFIGLILGLAGFIISGVAL